VADTIIDCAEHRKGSNPMATSAYQRVVPVYSGLDSTTAIALVLRRTAADDSNNRPFVRDVSDIFFELKQRGFRFKDLGLRKIPGGYYSEDVETFVGQLLSMGYAEKRSPIKLTKEGEKFCNEIEGAERNQDEVIRLREELEKVLQQTPTPA
jgi:hypothetical protein